MKTNKACLRRQGFAPIATVLIIIAVLVVGGVAYYEGKKKKNISQNTNTDLKEYKNDELGFSFKYSENLGVLEYRGIGKGESGETFWGGINFPQFYFAGNSRDYTAGEDGNFGRTNAENCSIILSKINDNQIKSSSRKTSEGKSYAFQVMTPLDGKQGFWGFDRGVAVFFTLESANKRFPCLGFSSVAGMSDEEFLKIIDTVKIY